MFLMRQNLVPKLKIPFSIKDQVKNTIGVAHSYCFFQNVLKSLERLVCPVSNMTVLGMDLIYS